MATGKQIADLASTVYSQKWGYIFGTAGVEWTQQKQNEITKDKKNNPDYANSIANGAKWIGHKVADCSGLVVYVLKQFGIKVPHGSNSMWRDSFAEKGAIGENALPVGAIVFKLRNSTDYYHVGIYVGNNEVVEAQGVNAGVVKTKLSTWGYYGLLKGVTYSVPTSNPKSGQATVTAQSGKTVNVRLAPKGNAKIVDRLPIGSLVNISKDEDGWCQIEYIQVGWMKSEFLDA